MPFPMSRRSAMGLLGAGVVAGAAIANGSNERVAHHDLGPVAEGFTFARWTVKRIETEDGALVVTVAGHDGEAFSLEILARDTSPLAPKPPASTEGLAIFVRNGGDGASPTDEEQGIAAMTFAQVLDAQGRGGAIAGLLTHADRIAVLGDRLVPPDAALV